MKRVLLLFLLFCLFRSESDFWPWREHLHWSTDVIREECRIDPIPSVVDHNENINCTSELERIWNPSTEQFLRFATSIKDFHETAQQLQDSLRKLQILFKAPLDETNTWASVLHVLNNDTVDYEIVFSYCASSWEASSNLTNFRSLLQKTCSFISTVRSQIDVGSSPFEERVRVLVIGGGPLGLASSIESHLKGSRTTVVEKRTDYTRNTWFDVHGPPWSMALDKLKLWGIQFQDMEHVRHQEADNMIGMRNQMLERFLSKVASMIGIEMRYGWELGTICSDDSKNFAILHPRSNSTFNLNACQTHTNDSLQVEFDVILGAEGSSSKVREFFNITFLPQTRFALPNKRVVQVENLHQPSLIVNFSPVDGECPRLKKVSSGYFLDPHFPGFSIEGVTSVWKRFYSTYCSMQILMTREIGDKIVSNYRTWRNVSEEDNRWQDKAFPWEKIRQVADMLIERPITTIHSLKKMIPKKSNKNWDIDVVNVVIHKSSKNALLWEPPGNRLSIASLVGDASVTAHYRLGVGINNGFLALKELGEMISDLNSVGRSHLQKGDPNIERFKEIIQEKEDRARVRIDRLVQFQLSTMFYEAYCEYAVFFDFSKKNYWETQMIHYQDKQSEEYLSLTLKQLLNNCPAIQELLK